jgi:TM2 domain-containing membrane protein YozV
MKRAILAPLCSAVVIPGLGQIINGERRKGTAILLAVFVLFLAGMTWLFRTVSSVSRELAPGVSSHAVIVDRLREKDFTLVWLLLLAFALLWLFSVLDAFWKGRSTDHHPGDPT